MLNVAPTPRRGFFHFAAAISIDHFANSGLNYPTLAKRYKVPARGGQTASG
jgi:hypothetical protein